jgi:hypothetical protein
VHKLGNRLGALEQHRAGGTQAHAAAMACEQRHAQLLLQFSDLPAQRGLGEAQLVGGAADTAGARNVHEIAKLFQFHLAQPRLCRNGIA